MNNIEELLDILRRDGTNKPLQSVLEQAKKLRQDSRAERPKKRRKQDKRTRRRKFYEWRREHADELREYNSGLRQMFFHLRREVNRRAKKERDEEYNTSWEWQITIGEWITMWLSCPAILVGQNVYKPAWKCRGRSKDDVQLRRIDTEKPWNINNLQIIYRNKVLFPSVG